MPSRIFLSGAAVTPALATHHGLAARGGRCLAGRRWRCACGHLRGWHLWARRAFAADPAAAGAAGRLVRVRQGPASHPGAAARIDGCALFHSAPRLFAIWVSCLRPASSGVLMDLGVSSPQIDTPSAVSVSVSMARWTCAWTPRAARAWPSGWPMPRSAQIAEVIRDYGEERFAGPIAKAIVARRDGTGPPCTPPPSWPTSWLARSRPASRARTLQRAHFRLLRIFINAELEELQQALEASLHGAARRAGGWWSSASTRWKTASSSSSSPSTPKRSMTAARRLPRPSPCGSSRCERIKPSAAEVAANPRSRSAVMRVAERTEVPAWRTAVPPPLSARGRARRRVKGRAWRA